MEPGSRGTPSGTSPPGITTGGFTMKKTVKRKSETLFGSGQANASRKGRAASREPSMAQIMSTRTRHHLSNGRTVRKSLSERILLKLFVNAMHGDRHAMREIIARWERETEAAIRRPKPAPALTPEKYAEFSEGFKVLHSKLVGADCRVLAYLETNGVVYRLRNGEFFVDRWAVLVADKARRQRLQIKEGKD